MTASLFVPNLVKAFLKGPILFVKAFLRKPIGKIIRDVARNALY